jgi:hypothetical protein
MIAERKEHSLYVGNESGEARKVCPLSFLALALARFQPICYALSTMGHEDLHGPDLLPLAGKVDQPEDLVALPGQEALYSMK